MPDIIRVGTGNIDSMQVNNDTLSFFINDNEPVRGPIVLYYALQSGDYCILTNKQVPFDPRNNPGAYKKYNHWEFKK